MSSAQRLAVIDLGSNSFRLVVFTAGDGWWQRTDEIYEPVRIGEGLAGSGRLGTKPIERALATLEVFAHFCRASGLSTEQIDAVATSAIRDAENSDQVLQPARERIGLPVRVLSREQEAHYGHLAAVNSTTLSEGAVLDLGGGSLQLVQVSERRARGEDPAEAKQIDALREHVAAQLAESAWLAQSGKRIVGMGGTARNLAAAAQRIEELPSNGVQGFLLTSKALRDLIERLAALPPKERAKVPGIKPARADLILAGAIVIEGVLEAGGFEGLEVTEAGLREGVFFERHLGGGDRQPLFDDVREAGVLNLARRYRMDAPHSRHVAELALGMFDELAALGLHPGDPRERELLWAACMLHDIGMSVDYDDHHKHSRYLILNGGLPGFSPSEVAIVAQAARYHRKGMPEPGELAPLFGEGDRERLDRCATLLRLAEALERSRDQLVRDTAVVASNGGVRITLMSEGETAVPRWAAGREGELFQRAFGRRLQIAA